MVNLTLSIPGEQEGEERATDRQIQFIKVLMRETGLSGFPEETLNDLGKWQASSMIDQLQDFKRQMHGEIPVDISRVSGLESESIWQKNVGWIVLTILGIVIFIWLAS